MSNISQQVVTWACNRNILNTGQICFVFLININSLCIIPVLRIFIKTFYAFLTKTHAGECEQYTLVRSLMYQDIFGTRTSLKDPIVFIARVNWLSAKKTQGVQTFISFWLGQVKYWSNDLASILRSEECLANEELVNKALLIKLFV